jgi:hypothetical protein
MKKPISFYLILFLLLFRFLSFGQQIQQVVSSGGSSGTNANVMLDWTIGEMTIETFTGTSTILTQGFHQSKLIVTRIEPFLKQEINLIVYPNPVKWELILEFTTPEIKNWEYMLSDVSGKLMGKKKIETQLENIDVSFYPPGIYFLKVFEKEKSPSQTFKILKN